MVAPNFENIREGHELHDTRDNRVYEIVQVLNSNRVIKVLSAKDITRVRRDGCTSTEERGRPAEVEIKLIRLDEEWPPEAMVEFKGELVDDWPRVNNPAVALPIRSFDIEGGDGSKFVCVVSRLVKGRSLLEVLEEAETKRRGRIDEKQAYKYVSQVCDCVKALHSVELAHRDVTAENFIVEDEEKSRITLVGFGLSKEVAESVCHSHAVRGLRDISYDAPELYTNHPPVSAEAAYSGTKVDVWCIGVLAYRCVCGKYPFGPFDGDQGAYYDENMAQKIMCGEFAALPDDITDGCRGFITAALEPDPKKRPYAHELSEHKWIHECLVKEVSLEGFGISEKDTFSPMETDSCGWQTAAHANVAVDIVNDGGSCKVFRNGEKVIEKTWHPSGEGPSTGRLPAELWVLCDAARRGLALEGCVAVLTSPPTQLFKDAFAAAGVALEAQEEEEEEEG
eukprot:PRCOL_00002383-RA